MKMKAKAQSNSIQESSTVIVQWTKIMTTLLATINKVDFLLSSISFCKVGITF